VEQPTTTPTSSGTLTVFCYALAVVELLLLYMVPVHLPFYAPELGIGSGLEAGLAIAFMLLVMSTTSVIYHRLQARLSFPLLHGAGLLLLAAGYILLGGANAPVTALLALAIAGIGLGLIRPNVVIWLLSVTMPALRGRVMGGLTTCFFVGQFISPVITQPVAQAAGYANLFHWTGFLVLSITAIALVGRYFYHLFYRAEPLTR
jgi:MFS family permease